MTSELSSCLCALCATPVGWNPRCRVFEGTPLRFCCGGCLNVYAILLDSGALASGDDPRASEVFQESLRLGLIGRGPEAGLAPPPDAEVREQVYQVSGLWCGACAWLIEHALSRQHGVVSVQVLFPAGLLKVTFCPQWIAPARIVARVAALGYRVAEPGSEPAPVRPWPSRRWRLGLAGVLGLIGTGILAACAYRWG